MKDARPGSLVKFKGLSGAAHLNGQEGRLVRWFKREKRWAVRTKPVDGPEELVKCKAANLVLVSREEATSSHSDESGLHAAVMDAYRNRGGCVVSSGDRYMLAIDFGGAGRSRTPLGSVEAECVYVGRDDPVASFLVRQRGCRSSRELGTEFLRGREPDYVESTNDRAFLALLDRYKRRMKSSDAIDFASGLFTHTIQIW